MVGDCRALMPSVTRSVTPVKSGINRLKRHRAVATRYDRLAVRYEATVHGAAINEWLGCLVHSQPLAHGDVTMHQSPGHEPGRS